MSHPTIYDLEYWEAKMLQYEEWEHRRRRGLLGRLWDWLRG